MRIDLRDVSDFPTLPGVADKIIQMAVQKEVSIDQLANVIRSDVALSARVLKTVNSSYYSLPREITSIPEAVSFLGLNMVRNIALSLTVFDSFRDQLNHASYSLLVSRALSVAVSAEAIASATRVVPSEDAFMAGMFGDLGLFLLARLDPTGFENCLAEAERRDIEVVAAVNEWIQGDQAEAALRLAEHWRLPELVRLAIRYHADPQSAASAGLDPRQFHHVLVAHLGQLASRVYTDRGKALRLQLFKQGYAKYLKRSEAEAEELLQQLGEAIAKGLESLALGLPSPQDFMNVLQEANAELGRITIRYELMYHELRTKMTELDERNRELAGLTRELDAKNKVLQDLAVRDGLTGAYNHRYFQEFLQKQVHQSRRSQQPLALVLLDIDHFKRFNDSYGHQCGDLVLQELAKGLQATARQSDVVARYGGEEFALILDNSDLRAAVIAAERLRREIERYSVPLEGQVPVHFTVSLGVAQLDIGRDEPHDLIRRADAALYEAKRGGRNRVSISSAPAQTSARAARVPPSG